MLRDRFFQKLELEDIWLYRLIPKQQHLYFSKFTYDLEKWEDCPLLFAKKIEKSKLSKLLNSLYVYIAINPDKKLPVLQLKSEADQTAQAQHYSEL